MTLDSWKDPFKAAWPIMAGYVVLGLPCGILGVAAGMDVWICLLYTSDAADEL